MDTHTLLDLLGLCPHSALAGVWLILLAPACLCGRFCLCRLKAIYNFITKG